MSAGKRHRLGPHDNVYQYYQRSSSPPAGAQQKGPVMEEAAMALLLLDGSAIPPVHFSLCCTVTYATWAILQTVPVLRAIGLSHDAVQLMQTMCSSVVTTALKAPLACTVVAQSANGHKEEDAELPRLRPQRSRSFHAADTSFSEDEDAGLPPAAKLPKCVPVSTSFLPASCNSPTF